jgi:hypothetical protein
MGFGQSGILIWASHHEVKQEEWLEEIWQVMVCGSIQCQMRLTGFRQRCLELATHLIIDAYQLNRDSLMPIHPLGD